jgi:hypothetical protein
MHFAAYAFSDPRHNGPTDELQRHSRYSRCFKHNYNALYDAIHPDCKGPEALLTYKTGSYVRQNVTMSKTRRSKRVFWNPPRCHEARRSKRGSAINGFTQCGADALNRMARLKSLAARHTAAGIVFAATSPSCLFWPEGLVSS